MFCGRKELNNLLLLSLPSRTSVAFGGREGNGISVEKNIQFLLHHMRLELE